MTTNTAFAQRVRSAGGAILIHVGIAILVLMGLSAFVLDEGVVWLAREQAQNAADAGALAGASSLAFDSFTDLTTTGPAYRSAVSGAQRNNVLGVAATPTVRLTGFTGPPACTGATPGCVQVNVYRDGTNGSAVLPVFFASIFGVTSQSVNATATAQAVAANDSGCMRPWFIEDTYTDANNDGVFDAGDTYTNPGYKIPDDIGNAVTFHANTSPSGYGQLDVGSGGNAIRDAIEQCAGSFHIGEAVRTKPGNTLGPEKQGIDQLLAWDPNARWDPGTESVIHSCAPSCSCPGNPGSVCPNGPGMSPLVVQAAICSPTEASCAAGGPANSTVNIVNILSFFITGYTNASGNLDINAILMGSAGNLIPGPGGSSNGTFIRTVTLVR